MTIFESVGNIGLGTPDAIPVKEIGPAIGYYTQVLGFSTVEQAAKTAKLRRDKAEIGLAVNGEDPEQASIYLGVSDVDALRAEYVEKGIQPTEIRTDTYEGNRFRVFFAKEPYGVCFCFGTKIDQ